jgi:phosphoglycolate phosphatase-like HAD superfamily hydrolase
MLLRCLVQLQVTAVGSLIAVGDTASDMLAGTRAGAGLCVGVLTGTDDAMRLALSGADVTLDSVVDILGLDLF